MKNLYSLFLNLFKKPSKKRYEAPSSRGHADINEWINSEIWDGKDRVVELVNTLSFKDKKINSGSRLIEWLLATSNTFSGNTGNPLLLIISGPPSIGKSVWFNKLIPEEFHFNSGAFDIGHKSDENQILIFSLCQIDELNLSKTTKLKEFLTRNVDQVRPPYSRTLETRPRQTSFYATVNNLSIPLSNSRRCIPIEVNKIDYLHQINMQQLWAQIKLFIHKDPRAGRSVLTEKYISSL